MNSARLRYMVRIERNTPTLNTFGEEESSWSLFAIRRASIEPLRGREFWTSQEQESEITHRLRLRWDDKLSNVTTKDRIGYGSRNFDIKSIINPMQRGEEMQLMCIEKV